MKYLAPLYLMLLSLNSFADCKVFKSNGLQAVGLSDVLFKNLESQSKCPENVFELKDILQQDGLQISPSMVANRGRHNPKFGSFSFFEIAKGHSKLLGKTLKNDELYFGHFTQARAGVVNLDQSPRPGKLLIELIAWDSSKEVYNFYELIGKQSGATWFYRGDSTDAFKDNQLLHRQKNPSNPQFGRAMRCSACHTSGGPIMKEIEAPHNDWWTKARPLPFGNNTPSSDVKVWLTQLIEASEFSQAVKSGIKKLEESKKLKGFKKSLSFQEQQRPLFCTTEINLISDQKPLEAPSMVIQVPSSYWINPLLVSSLPVEVNKVDYVEVLRKEGFKFPEINRIDADHGWLAPIKGYSDIGAIKTLIRQGVVDDEFVADVLAVDFKKPLFSIKRCSLLKLLPSSAEANWKSQLVDILKSSNLKGAKELHRNLTSPDRDKQFHQNQAELYLDDLEDQIHDIGVLKDEVMRLHRQRLSVFENEISKNPLGQILEPGFRVIFPEKSL